MTDVKSDPGAEDPGTEDPGTEVKFGVSASTTFVGATQALVSLTPTKNGSAAFLAVADTETIPSAIAAETLLAYREIDFSGTSAQIIQFALSISATQDATGGEVSGGSGAVLQPGTAYKIVMYSSGNSATLLTFTTLGNLAEGYTYGKVYTFAMSAHNFLTKTGGKFQVPFVFSWLDTSSTGTQTFNLDGNGGIQGAMIVFNSSGYMPGSASDYATLVNAFGDSNQGGVFLHTPRSGAIRDYRTDLRNGAGDRIFIIYNVE
ncbi:hypothetical protein P0082_01800 [Candidatus Haliotispira prima]|uniref:Uncharacterized protein n=1 Tax=Candidatus Haliotispira prima TaxID=3034016 RepID=A0ABY8MI00_9SPIO|nr:hypothetical protein P0082_01800 [Candidatus Haliotispira prima]